MEGFLFKRITGIISNYSLMELSAPFKISLAICFNCCSFFFKSTFLIHFNPSKRTTEKSCSRFETSSSLTHVSFCFASLMACSQLKG